MTRISASILACNFAYLADEVRKAEDAGVHSIHIDIMDGRYVENITFGPQLITDLKAITSLPMEVHLEMFEPDRYLDMFAKAGSDRLVVQRDCCSNPIRTMNRIRELGMEAGIAVNPADDVSLLTYLLNYIDFIIIMSVEPGFGGQNFEESSIEKIRKLKQIMFDQGLNIPIAVDGGINVNIAERLRLEGVDILVVGSGLFKTKNLSETVQELLNG